MTLEYALKQNGINPKKDLTIDTSIDFASMAGAFIGGTGDFVNTNKSEDIANVIMNQFPDTSYNDIKNAIDSYKKNNTWPKTTNFSENDFNHLQDIVIEAGFLDKKVSYKDLIYER